LLTSLNPHDSAEHDIQGASHSPDGHQLAVDGHEALFGRGVGGRITRHHQSHIPCRRVAQARHRQLLHEHGGVVAAGDGHRTRAVALEGAKSLVADIRLCVGPNTTSGHQGWHDDGTYDTGHTLVSRLEHVRTTSMAHRRTEAVAVSPRRFYQKDSFGSQRPASYAVWPPTQPRPSAMRETRHSATHHIRPTRTGGGGHWSLATHLEVAREVLEPLRADGTGLAIQANDDAALYVCVAQCTTRASDVFHRRGNSHKGSSTADRSEATVSGDPCDAACGELVSWILPDRASDRGECMSSLGPGRRDA
jgi:hypothetical protein